VEGAVVVRFEILFLYFHEMTE